VQFDDLSETVTKENEQYVPKSEWQTKTHLRQVKRIRETSSAAKTTDPPTLMPTAAAVPTPSVTPALEQVVLDLPLKEYGSLQPINQDMEPPPPLIIEPEQPLQEGQQQAQQPVRRSTRIRRPPARHADYVPHSQIAFESRSLILLINN
jgi:hypothetical protein